MFGVPFQTLVKREISRFWVVKTQTLVQPLITSLLYLFIFGVSLGKKINAFHDLPYIQFIIPGLMMMGIINNAYQNTSSSLLISKYEKNIIDILIAPIAYYEITLAYIIGGIARGLLVGLVVFLTSLLFTPFPIQNLFFTLVIASLSAAIFAMFGIFTGIWADKFDEMARFNTFIILPLTYLGGVFYSLSILPKGFKEISYLNPLLYMVDGLRYGMLGVSDVPPAFSLIFLCVVAVVSFFICLKIFETGWRLRQ